MILRISLETGETSDLVLASKAVRYMQANAELKDAWLMYGDPAKIRILIRRTKSSFSLYIQKEEQ